MPYSAMASRGVSNPKSPNEYIKKSVTIVDTPEEIKNI